MSAPDDWENEWENADPANKPAAKPAPADVPMPAGHPSVPTDGTAALCPYLLRGGGGGGESDAPLSNGGKVPRRIYWITLLDMLGVGLVIPIIPAYAKSLGASALSIHLPLPLSCSLTLTCVLTLSPVFSHSHLRSHTPTCVLFCSDALL